MTDLPPRLRAYLWSVFLATLALLVAWVLLTPTGSGQRETLLAAAACVVLAYLGERTALQVNGSITQSLSTAVHILAILVLPAPAPVLVTLLAVLASQVTRTQAPWYKRVFNICHPTLTVGLSSAILAPFAVPTAILHPHYLLAALPVLSLLVALYYVLDVGLLLGVLSLAQNRSLWSIWNETYRPTLLPELAAITVGILGAIAWRFDPVALALAALPVLALRIAYHAIRRAEDQGLALRRRSEQLEAVLDAGQHLRVQHNRSDLLLPMAAAARTIAAATAVTAYLRDEGDQATLRRVLVVPEDAPAPGPAYLPLPAADDGDTLGADAHGALQIPLTVDGVGTLGLLALAGVPATLGHDDRDALAILATQAAIGLQNALLHERAVAQASADSLTGLLNHRSFQTRLEEEIARAQRGGHPLAVLMIDLDDFRTINNTFGHQAGDATLTAIASALRQSLRATDLPARYGGDEFAVILPETDVEEALVLARRAHAALAALTVAAGGGTIGVNTSMGVAVYPRHAGTREELVRVADRAAYRAKHGGKGRVCEPGDALPELNDEPAALAHQLKNANMVTVEALAAAVDAKDPYTQGHSQRVSAYAEALARALGLSALEVARVRLAGLLHDVGKIGIPDAILTKQGELTADEMSIIMQHPEIGERMLAGVPFLRDVLPAVRHHHERWDGQGYPDGLAGEAIPREAAILMVADALDAMTSSRTYRAGVSIAEARQRIRAGSGTQFDPAVAAAFERAVAAGELALTLVEHMAELPPLLAG